MSDARPHPENLYDALLAFAEQRLESDGAFYPFCYTVDPAGALAALAYVGESDAPPSRGVIGSLTTAIRSKASNGEIIAAGICSIAGINPTPDRMADAICMDIEHVSDSLRAVVPYVVRANGAVEYGAPGVSDRAPSLFAR